MTTDRAAELHADLIDRVKTLRSSVEWLEAMTVAARFHEYSFGNWMLLWSQAERRNTTISRIAGYRTWQQLGRHVRRGERGYQILAPITRTIRDDDEPETGARRMVCGFRVATVFDLAQTDGEPLPDVAPRLVTGADSTDLYRVAVEMIEAESFRFELGRLAGPNGVTRPAERSVTVDDRLEPAQRTKTTIHELAHVLIHAGDPAIDCRGRIEVEAESVAFVVCTAAGIDTSGYSVPYVAGWAQDTDDPPQTLLRTAEQVVRTARRILTHLDNSEALPAMSDRTPSSHYAIS